MGTFLDTVPVSAIIRIRDLMHTVKDPFRLDQGDVSFDAPDTVKQAMTRAIAENKTHYLPTTGVPRLKELLAEKLRTKNRLPIASPEEVIPTNGGTHALWATMHALFEPGDEMIVADPEWPPTMAIAIAAGARAVPVRLHESLRFRWDLDELERAITPHTKAIYVNSPNTPPGGVLTRADLERIAEMARERNLWVLSDESYEDLVYEGEHVSIASLPGMYERTISLFTFSKSYAMTGLRLGYFALPDATLRARGESRGLHHQQRELGRAMGRHRGAGGAADVHRGVSQRAARPARSLLRRPRRIGAWRLQWYPPGRRVLRLRAYQPRVRERGRHRRTVALVGDGRTSDQTRADRLRSRR